MKEITRIHLAKTSYDIETIAKKDLEQYLKQVELYASDSELVQDIEIRIVELLGERGVLQNGVITDGDIQAVREQLGEPQDFMGDGGDIAVGVSVRPRPESRRLYRDLDGAVVGGVLSGVSAYIGVRVVWVRLLFIILLFASFGTVLLVYALLWILLPPARTAAEKLQLAGKPVTLASLRTLSDETKKVVNTTPGIIKKILRIGSGVVLACLALGVFAVSVGGGVMVLLFGAQWVVGYMPSDYGWVGQTAICLFVVSGLLLTALSALWSFVAFAGRMTRRIGVVTMALILGGGVVFGGGIGLLFAQTHYETDYVRRMTTERIADLPSGALSVKSIAASAHSAPSSDGRLADFTIEYIVDSGTPRYRITSLPDVEPDFYINGSTMRVALKTSATQLRRSRVEPRLVIYGPALDDIRVEQGKFRYTALGEIQQHLAVETLGTTEAYLEGTYGQLSAHTAGSLDASASSVADLSAVLEYGSVTAGVVRTLSVTQPDACPADTVATKVSVRSIVSGEMTYNGTIVPATTIKSPCGVVYVGAHEKGQYQYD